jgi:hypothetical protein
MVAPPVPTVPRNSLGEIRPDTTTGKSVAMWPLKVSASISKAADAGSRSVIPPLRASKL